MNNLETINKYTTAMEPLMLEIPNIPANRLQWKYSFLPYLQHIEKLADQSAHPVYKEYLDNVAKVLHRHPRFLEPTDTCIFDGDCEEVLELLSLPPAGLVENGTDIFAVGIPFPFTAFYYSARFRELFGDADEHLLSELVLDEYERNVYADILTQCYGIQLTNPPVGPHLIRFRLNSKNPGYYYLITNTNFRKITCNGDLPDIKDEWIDFANHKIHDLSKLTDPLPMQRFVAEGFLTFRAIDRTEEECIAALRKAVSEMHTKPVQETFKRIKEISLMLLGEEEMEMGLLAFLKVNEDYAFHNAFRYSSILFSRLYKDFDRAILEDMYQNMVKEYMKRQELTPLIFNTLNEHTSISEPANPLSSYDLKSMAFFPVWNHGMLLGVVELGSKVSDAINQQLLRKIEMAMPVFKEFLLYQIAKVNENINSFILKRYTAIQPSVKWKFNESSWQFINAPDEREKNRKLPEIRFENLYAYYGASDIRNSSVERIKSLNIDFAAQLSGLEAVLNAICTGTDDEYVADFKGELLALKEYISDNITLEQEENIREFIYSSVGRVAFLRDKGILSEAIAYAYISNVKEETSVFYKAASNYEQSMDCINETLKKILEQYEIQLQDQLPVYFEKFKTDGWEYNLYAGKELSREQVFPTRADEIIMRWQVDMMIDIARVTRTLENLLPHKLQTTQLILSHPHLLSVSFRIDERRFDVEGAYSIRYEVVKKRIDKAHIENTEERLTQPGTIAIVYSSDKEADKYSTHLQTLIDEGKLEPGIEQLKLEKLQGITGLRAMRVKLKY